MAYTVSISTTPTKKLTNVHSVYYIYPWTSIVFTLYQTSRPGDQYCNTIRHNDGLTLI